MRMVLQQLQIQQNKNKIMEFTITKKATNTAFGLIGVGALLAIVGIITNIGEAHFTTRLMTNGLINAFFFFAIGLGALFFLALNYATEAGWYAVVKRIIEAVALFLPYGMGIFALILLTISFMKGAHIYTWMDGHTVAEDELIQGKSA